MNKQICLITGATEGIGKVTAMELAKRGFTVVLAARSEAKAKIVKEEIAATSGNADTDYIVADLSFLRQIHQLAETFKQRYRRLDALINNAGIFMPTRTVTEDGYKTTYQVNYLSHFHLTPLFLGELMRSEQGRIIKSEFQRVHNGQIRRGQPPERKAIFRNGSLFRFQALHANVFH
jgi:NAD(P)-dependent dehydrogenase (short-subunit alcohol dehydrogenase family)